MKFPFEFTANQRWSCPRQICSTFEMIKYMKLEAKLQLKNNVKVLTTRKININISEYTMSQDNNQILKSISRLQNQSPSQIRVSRNLMIDENIL